MPSSGRKTNLVPPLGRFFGRTTLLDAIAAHISHGERLITLLGAPGIGKTRLALRYGELHGEGYRRAGAGGVWFCDLTEARDEADVLATVARVLGARIREEDGAEIVGQTIAEAGPILLILDNFEQVATVAGHLVERWCAVAAEACFLVTSRTRLGIIGERVVELPALEEAADLFIERARAAGWKDSRPSATGEIADLVRALDGIPLAIELAAARSPVLAPREMLARIESERSRILPTLKAAIDSSWNALSEGEKTALAECAVFAGDFSFEAAEGILDVPSVLDVLTALRSKSLVRSTVDAETGTTRFSLFVSIREYASARAVEHFDRATIEARYRRFYLDATEAWVEEHARTGDGSLLAKVTKEKEHLDAIQRDLRAKKDLALDAARDLARAVLHLQPLITTESFGGGGVLAMLTHAIDAANAAGVTDVLPRLFFARGLARGVRGDMNGSISDLASAQKRASDAGDRVLEASALFHLGARYRVQEKFDDAGEVTARAIDLLEKAAPPHPRLLGQALACMGLLLGEQGRAEAARPFDLRARAVLHACGDRWSEALALANLAQLDQAAGHFEEAAHGYEQAIERFHESGDRRFVGRYRGYRAGLELERGDLDTARAEFATALEILSVARAAHIEGSTRGALGALEAISGHAREAMMELDRAEDLLSTTDAPGFVVALDVHRGQLDLARAREAIAKGDRDRAAKLIASAEQRIAKAKVVRSEDARFALRLLQRELAKTETAAPSVHAPIEAARLRGLDVGPESRWFRVGEGPPVDLGRRGALRLLLDGLVTRRLDAPGAMMDWETLLAIGWPGERVLAGAGATRVRVAISTLRRLGLAGLLVTREDGYLLEPRAAVRRVGDGI